MEKKSQNFSNFMKEDKNHVPVSEMSINQKITFFQKEKKHKTLLKNHTFCSVLVISWCVESKEHQPNFSNTCLGRLGRGVYGSNMVVVAKKVRKLFFCWKMEKNNSFFHFLSFLKKNGWLRFVAKKQPNHLFQKIPNFMNETKKFSKSPI